MGRMRDLSIKREEGTRLTKAEQNYISEMESATEMILVVVWKVVKYPFRCFWRFLI
jgi:hypothetical protein